MESVSEYTSNGKKYSKAISKELEMDYCDKVYNDSNSEYLSTFNLSNYFCIKSGVINIPLKDIKVWLLFSLKEDSLLLVIIVFFIIIWSHLVKK